MSVADSKKTSQSKDRKSDSGAGASSDAIVIGDGWSALGAVGFLVQAGRKVHWITGTGSRMLAPLPTLETGPGVYVWEDLAHRFEIETGELKTGSYLREFRNKAFREPAWTKAPTPGMRRDVRDEELWEPECRIAGAFEARFEKPIAEIEEKIRERLLSHENVLRTEENPVQAFRFEKGEPVTVVLGSGDEFSAEQVFYADRWSVLPAIEGMPKPISFLRGRDPIGVLQASLAHDTPMGAELNEAFFATINKEAGEEIQRHIWGYFFNEGSCSIWSVLLTQSEVEDNHEIAKKLRRMKQALDRMFTGTEWLPEEKKDFSSNMNDEQVRFEEAVIFAGGKAPTEPVTLSKAKGMYFLTDGHGPSSAMHQVALALGEELQIRTEKLPSSEEQEFAAEDARASEQAAPEEERTRSGEAEL